MMASYNGERFIKEQIESICNQDYDNWHLIIQDDGSTDRTCEIIKHYISEDNRIELRKNKTVYHGAYSNFHLLADYCKTLAPYDFYMFSDHDDVWLPDKLSRMVEHMTSETLSNVPALGYGDMQIINDKGDVTANSLSAQWKNGYKNGYDVFFSHKIFGCNMIMNSALFNLCPVMNLENPIARECAHDAWYANFAGVFGKILYWPETFIQYRRYGDNVTTELYYTISVRRIFNRLLRLRFLAKKHAIIYNQSLYALKIMKTMQLTETQKQMVYSIEKHIRSGGFGILSFIKKHHIVWGSAIENISRKLILCSGLYKQYLYIENGK